MNKLTIGTAALLMALSLASCGNKDTADEAQTNNADTTTTTVTTPAPAAPESADAPEAEETTTTTAAAAETSAAESSSSETEKETSVVSGALPDEFDDQLDSMIASAEALIPDVPTIDFDLKTDTESKSGEETTTTAAPETKAPETTTAAEQTTTAAKAEAPAADLKNEQQFVFDGVLYDNSTFTSKGLKIPDGWSLNSSVTEGQYENSAYPNSAIIEDRNKGGSFLIANAKSKNESSIPSLQLYKGLTWGATVDEIESAYGEPAKEGHSEQYGTQLTNIFYKGSDGSLIVYSVSSDWGLIDVMCFGR